MTTNVFAEGCCKNRLPRRHARGFSLLEMSMVLVIIGVIMSAVMIGTDLLRHAKGQNAFSSFVVGWSEAFAQYTRATGRVPADDLVAPTNLINRGAGPLCGDDLRNDFLRAGIRIPQGRGNGFETQYRYQDSAGSTQTLSVCFETVNWAVPTAGIPNFQAVARHTMSIAGLTTELAMQLDVLIDGNPSGRFGKFRRFDPDAAVSPHVALDATPVGWGAITNGDEDDARNLATGLLELN